MIFMYMIMNFVFILLLVILMLISVAFLTLFERKFLGYIQIRKGPNKVGFGGLMQPFSDVIKLLNKEFFFIDKINYMLYMFSVVLILFLSIMLWGVYFFYYNLYSMNYSVMYVLLILSMGVYPIMIGGWSSNSNYSLLGCLRSVAQSVSFEVSLFFMMFIIIIFNESYSFYDFIFFDWCYSILFLFPIYLMCMVSMLIELNRTPFDLVEGESELVSGFNTEYFGGSFALIFMAEYLSIIFMSFFMVVMFFSVNINSCVFKFLWMIHIFFIVLIRGTLPRIRYDELMYLCWKKFLSVVLIYVYLIFVLKMYFMVII